MTWYLWGYPMPDLTVQQWILLLLVIAIYFYVFVNYLIRKTWLRVGYFDDGEGFDVFNCKVIGNQVEFFPEQIKKFYGIIPLQRRQHVDAVRKDIAAKARTWVRGPRTFKVYFCAYNSPTTINPTEREFEDVGLSLGHESIRSTLREVSIGGGGVTRKDYVTYVLLIAVGMLIYIMLQKFFPVLKI